MIILLSKDFTSFAHALQELYAEPGIECLKQSNWLQDLTSKNDGEFTSRLTIIGHSDSFHGGDQSFFGGNLNERVMLIDEFAHSLINMLKYNERQKPGFCQHLQYIDIIDCHIGERKFIAQIVADYLHDDDYLREYGAHIKISGFANSHHPKSGTVLMPHELQRDTLSFYTFDTPRAFDEYQDIHSKLTELESERHHLQQMPGHTVILTNGQSRNETIARLEKKCETLQKKESKILKEQTHKVLHISDPRQYFDKHKACQILVADAKPLPCLHASKKHSTAHSKKNVPHAPHFFAQKPIHSHPKHTSYLEGSTLHTSKHALAEEFASTKHKKF